MKSLRLLCVLPCLVGPLLAAGPSTSLREVFRDDFAIGVAIGSMVNLGESERGLIRREFGCVTTEAHLKPFRVQPREGEFNFAEADANVEFARAEGLPLIGHTLLWHKATPDWFFVDGDRPASRELLLRRMEAHIRAVVGRYRGRIKGWDVINEGISDEAPEFLRRNRWQEIIGDDYVARAFTVAREADPGAELYFNDYGNEYPGKRAKTVRLIRELQARGVRVDGIGMQLHLQLDRVPFDEIERSLVAFRELGVKVMITELDLDLVERAVWGADTKPVEESTENHLGWAVAPPDLLQRQAEQYARLFALLCRHRDVVDRVTFWNLHDGKSWLNNWPVKGRTNHPLLFDRDLRPKPAYDAVMAVGRGPR